MREAFSPKDTEKLMNKKLICITKTLIIKQLTKIS